MDALTSQCVSQSVGPANQLFGLLIQTILAAQCSISPPEMWPKDYGPTAIEKGLEEYDFIVVGAGSAGSVVASRLSENENWKVLLLEAGGDPPIESEIPLLFLKVQNTTHDWGYFTEKSKDACLGTKNSCYWPRGKLLGGSSAINALIYVRGNRRDYDHWSKLGNPTWDWDNVLEYFKKSEDNQVKSYIKDKKHHSVGGPLKVNQFDSPVAMKTIFTLSFYEMGYEDTPDINADKYLGITTAQVVAHDGARCSTAKAFLLPAKDRPNLHIIKNAHVTNLEYNQDGSVKGVKFLINELVEQSATVRKEVVLSAGAINTPQILMTSGIGPKDHLDELKIKVVKDLPVGKHLEDHVMIPYFLSFAKSSPIERSPRDFVQMTYQYLFQRTGELSNIGATDFMGFFSTVKDPKYPDIQLLMTYFYKNEPMLEDILNLYGYEDDIIESILATSRYSETVMLFVVLLNPKSVGKIELRSADPFDPPKIHHNYLTEEDDVDTLVRGIRILRSISYADVYKTFEGEDVKVKLPICDEFRYDSEAYWKCYIRHMSLTMYHPTGTAKMGPESDDEAVVNSVLRVKGVKGLRVVDASIMPKIVSGNTNAPTIMIAEKAADFIKEEYANK